MIGDMAGKKFRFFPREYKIIHGLAAADGFARLISVVAAGIIIHEKLRVVTSNI